MEPDDERSWVVVRSFDDPVEAEITSQFLRDHGIPVALQGNSGSTAILNRFTTVIDIRLVVPEAHAAEAREALTALVESAVEHPFRGKGPSDGEQMEVAARPRSRAAAFILAILVPIGAGHFYAQHTAGAIVLGSGIVGAWLGALVGARPELLTAAALLVAADALFAPLAVARLARGCIPDDGRQRIVALAAVAIAFAIALAQGR